MSKFVEDEAAADDTRSVASDSSGAGAPHTMSDYYRHMHESQPTPPDEDDFLAEDDDMSSVDHYTHPNVYESPAASQQSLSMSSSQPQPQAQGRLRQRGLREDDIKRQVAVRRSPSLSSLNSSSVLDMAFVLHLPCRDNAMDPTRLHWTPDARSRNVISEFKTHCNAGHGLDCVKHTLRWLRRRIESFDGDDADLDICAFLIPGSYATGMVVYRVWLQLLMLMVAVMQEHWCSQVDDKPARKTVTMLRELLCHAASIATARVRVRAIRYSNLQAARIGAFTGVVVNPLTDLYAVEEIMLAPDAWYRLRLEKYIRTHNYRHKRHENGGMMYEAVTNSDGEFVHYYEEFGSIENFIKDRFRMDNDDLNTVDVSPAMSRQLQEHLNQANDRVCPSLKIDRDAMAFEDCVLFLSDLMMLPDEDTSDIGVMHAERHRDVYRDVVCANYFPVRLQDLVSREVLLACNNMPFFKDGMDPRFPDGQPQDYTVEGFTKRVATEVRPPSTATMTAARNTLQATIENAKENRPCFNEVELEFVPEWWNMFPTPIIDSIFHRQLQEKCVADTVAGGTCRSVADKVLVLMFTYALIGRLLHSPREDDWQLQITLIGSARTGKSKIAEVILAFFPKHLVSIVMNNIEAGFGLEALVDSLMIYMQEVRPGAKLSTTDWLVMTEGGRGLIRRKNKISTTHQWESSIFATGNCAFGGEDLGSSKTRRMATVYFNSVLGASEIDNQLFERIKASNEIPMFMMKTNHAYLSLRRHMYEHDVKSYHSIQPKYFHDQQKLMSEGSSVVAQFLASNWVKYDRNGVISFRRIRQHFREYVAHLGLESKQANEVHIDMLRSEIYARNSKNSTRNLIVEETSGVSPQMVVRGMCLYDIKEEKVIDEAHQFSAVEALVQAQQPRPRRRNNNNTRAASAAASPPPHVAEAISNLRFNIPSFVEADEAPVTSSARKRPRRASTAEDEG